MPTATATATPTACIAFLFLSALAHPGTVKDMARVRGQGDSVLRGMGLVVGLPGTGDSGKDLALARPLAKLYESGGMTVGSPKELSNTRAVALVFVTCTIPAGGGYADDKVDCWVSVANNAKSLRGGQLFLTPMLAPFAASDVYAMAEGGVEIEGETETRARVRGGARLIKDVLMPEVGEVFDLILDQPFADWSAATQVAIAVNAKAQPGGPAVAKVIDERTIRVTIPEAELRDRAGFIADVLAAEVNLSQLDLAAQIIYNPRTGGIVVSGDAEIGPVAITHNNLNITTITPPLTGTPQDPVVRTDRWTGLETRARPSEKAKLSDLLAAFRQLDIPAQEQIGVLEMLHKMGKLHAKIVKDE